MKVNNFSQLKKAIQNKDRNIEITRSFNCIHSVILPDNTALKGETQENGELPLISFSNTDGLGITENNSITNLNIDVPAHHKAIYNSSIADDMGVIQLSNLLIKGQVSIITRLETMKANIYINNIDIHSAETGQYLEQPQKYGVNVLQGALTIYNLNPNQESVLTVNVKNLQIGRKNAPVSGSGVFIAGCGDNGGKTHINHLHTKSVYSNGKIPPGVSDYITGGVFVLNGAHAEEVITDGEVITYGINDMVLDVWGSVTNWVSNGPVISYGPSGVGFVNFGVVKNFTANNILQTYGLGARGYNQYDGTVENIHFKSIETFGDGSVGIQISKKIGSITIDDHVTTHGSVGSSLVKGHYVDLPAYALSITEGGEIDNLIIHGDLITKGDNVITYRKDAKGIIHNQEVKGKIIAAGNNSKEEVVD